MEVHTDGACRGNPGPSGAGCILEDSASKWAAWYYTGPSDTNNEAEYKSLLLGLRLARLCAPRTLKVFMDSKLVVEQVNDRWKVRAPHLVAYRDEAQALLRDFPEWELTHVLRRFNADADAAANRGVDDRNKHFRLEKCSSPE